MHCDKKLVEWMERYGVGEFRKDASKLEGLLAQIDNEEALNELLDVKQQNKTALKEYLEKDTGVCTERQRNLRYSDQTSP